ncbi:DUF3500 domain-containing protein [Glycomyces sp. TRM65418]|uniref:DUF3500 domain-containing protein n=1 Tax=Glycomyces sp. TRM65418 TaxID=2867006 RepID=UPI001CE4F5B4|nr:DUF3500 domain-containing protein [Glycomyces sp. TRM65418]MCC3764488.1 DUF3500 domain-containing protein [Glycomyces sp. TRM65418]QZD54159.1 DUF3500 domain-containing protein [Glycomyces sp. TRM65418]
MNGHTPNTAVKTLTRRTVMNRSLLLGGVSAVAIMSGCSGDTTAEEETTDAPTGGMPDGGQGGPGGSEAITYDDFVGVTTDGTVIDDLYEIHSTGVSTAGVIAAATAMLAGFSDEQREATLYDVESDQWFDWSNIHNYERNGVTMADLDDDQKQLVFDLIGAGLSADGLTISQNIMKLNQYAGDAMGQTDQFNEDAYYITVMGTPSDTDPWGWQYQGHHLVINYFVLGDQVVMSPTFMGTEPAEGTYDGEDIVLFTEHADAGLALVNALDDDRRSVALTSSDKGSANEVAGAGGDNTEVPYEGLQASEMTDDQRTLLLALCAVYINNLDEGHAEIRMDEIEAHLDDTYFMWVGETEEDSVFYYRIQSPVVLIQYDAQSPGPAAASYGSEQGGSPTRQHIHTLVRTPNGNDYGMDLLRLHLELDH